MQRRKLIMTGVAILVVGVAFAASRTAEDSGLNQEPARGVTKWQPGSEIPMAAYEMGSWAIHPPR